MVLTFQMEFILDHSQGKKIHDLDDEQLALYVALSKEQTHKINELKVLMINDQNI